MHPLCSEEIDSFPLMSYAPQGAGSWGHIRTSNAAAPDTAAITHTPCQPACMADGRLLHLAPQWCAEPLPVYLIYPYSNFYPAKLRRFFEALREGLPKGMGLPAREDGAGTA